MVGQEKEGGLATMSLEFEFHLQFPFGSASTELSDFCQSMQIGNEGECKQTFEKHMPKVVASLLLSSPPIRIAH